MQRISKNLEEKGKKSTPHLEKMRFLSRGCLSLNGGIIQHPSISKFVYLYHETDKDRKEGSTEEGSDQTIG